MNQQIVTMAAWLLAAVIATIYIASILMRIKLRWAFRMISSWWLAGIFLFATPHSATARDPWADPEVVAITPAVSESEYHTVVSGENLWLIAQHYASEDNVAELWKRIMSDNAHTIKSGNPNLIYPGEVIAINRNN